MTAQSNAPAVIIKKVKKVQAAGHHGGAWKVAYADFVTAMMAFFLLMWLLNATTEKQRKGIADYFSPTIPVTRVSGGGEGSFNGDSVFTEETLAQTGIGGVPTRTRSDGAGETPSPQETQALEVVQDMLTARTGESMLDNGVMRHVVTRVTDEGLLIELFDIVGDPLFEDGSAESRPVLGQLAGMMVKAFDLVTNDLAIAGHVQAQPVVLVDNRNWELSVNRANTMRKLLEKAGFSPQRERRVTGHADRQPAAADPMALRNNRIVLVLLRSGR